MSQAKLIFLHALTPVHSGTGQTVAVIDLPIAREKTTGYPVIPASSFKGVLRDVAQEKLDMTQVVDILFGGEDQAGLLCFTDQHLLFLPVRSYFGTFAYVTCPQVLNRLKRNTTSLNAMDSNFLKNIPEPESNFEVLLGSSSVLAKDSKIYLEDLNLTQGNPAETTAQEFAKLLFSAKNEQDSFAKRFAIVSDAVFSFLSETATEVVARIVLDDKTKIVENLWYEESIPAEAIFGGLIVTQAFGRKEDRENNLTRVENLLTRLNDSTVQVGGDASIGRGLCRVIVK